MKKIITTVVLITTLASQITFAQSEQLIQSKDPLNTILSNYLNLKTALTKEEGESASVAAKELFGAIDKVQTITLPKEQQAVWKKYAEKLSYDAEHIKGTTDIDHQREHFMSLSKNMFELVKAFNTNTAEVYYQYCPMANDGKGAFWVSDSEKINNPYLGKKMPTCGSTKETIKVKK
jgi:hypothetical protein